MREWIETGKVEIPDEPQTANAGQAQPTSNADRATIDVGAGVKVSQRQMDAFKEFGGTMQRTPSRRQAAAMGSAPRVL